MDMGGEIAGLFDPLVEHDNLFLANQFLGNGGNLDLGMNMVNWLAGDDAMITLQPRATVDGNLELGRGVQYFLLFGFLIFLPLSFAAVGTMIWWRRRKG